MQIQSKLTTAPVVHEVAHVAQNSLFGTYIRIVGRGLAMFILATAAILLIQLAYPRNLTTPLLRVNNTAVGLRSEDALRAQLDAMTSRSLSLEARQKAYQVTFAELGATVDAEASARQLTSYSMRDRLTPFSLFRRQVAPVVAMRHDDAKMRAWAQTIQQENSLPPKSAAVEVVQGEYAVTKPSEPGLSYDTEQLVQTIKSSQPGLTEKITIPAVTVEPAVSTEKAETAISQLRRQTTQETFLVVGEEKFTIPRTRLKQFIAISYDKKRDLLTSTYNKTAIKRYVASIAPKVYVAPVAAKISVFNGVTQSTTKARDGQQLNEPEAVKAIVAGLKGDEQTITVKPQVISATAQFSRSYSKNNKGLQILLQDWQSDTGLQAGVVVRELSGKGRAASINGSQQFLAASLAKLYLEHYLYNGMAAGKWSSKTKLGTSQTLGTCLEIMIVYSNNPCFNGIGANRGWSNVASFTAAQGFSSTNPNPAVYTTTAQDTAWFLQRLQNGSLIKSSYRSKMLSHMTRQIYREGIPSGSRGAVANKVGYWSGYRHDAGIVYHPKSTYVLSVLTYGGSPSQIADLARRVSNYMDK